MTRNPRLAGHVYGDIAEPDSLRAALRGCDDAVYLVHSLDRPDYVEHDRTGAQHFADAARRSRVRRLVYLGGLGADGEELSAHLASRREVEGILSAAANTVALRAGIVIGHGSAGWDLACQLVERLPALVAPPWANTPTQPIGLADTVDALVAALGRRVPRGHYDLGVDEVMTYSGMLRRLTTLMRRPVPMFPALFLPRWVAGVGVNVLTDADSSTARALMTSISTPAVVTERRFEELTGLHPMSFDHAAVAALAARLQARAAADRAAPR